MNEKKDKIRIKSWIVFIIVIIVLIGMYSLFIEQIKQSRLSENHCLKEESYFYRIESGLIFSKEIKTTKDKADGINYICIQWEEEPSFGASLLGQKLIWEKGSLKDLSKGARK